MSDLMPMGLSIEGVIYDYTKVMESVTDDNSYQKGREDAIDECKKIVMAECTTTCEYPFFPNCVECMTNKMEQLKEYNNG